MFDFCSKNYPTCDFSFETIEIVQYHNIRANDDVARNNNASAWLRSGDAILDMKYTLY